MNDKNGSTILASADRAPAPWEDQIELVKGLIGSKEIPNDQFEVFLYQCRRTGLDPLARQIYGLPFKTKNAQGAWETRLTIVTGIDGYRLIADRSGLYAGSDDATYGDPHKVKVSLTGRDGAVYKTLEIEAPRSATVTVYKVVAGVRCPFTGTARWDEYFPSRKPGKWEDMPYLMLAKCAEALALRKAFPADIYGLYIAEELDRAVSLAPALGSEIDPETGEVLPSDAPAPKAAPNGATTAAGAIAAAAKGAVAASINAQEPTAEAPKEDDPHDKARKRYWALHGELGLPPHNAPIDKALNYWAWGKVLGREVASMKDITIIEMSKLIDWAVRMLEGWTDERGETKKWAKPNYEEQRLKLVAAMQPALEEAPLEGKPLAAAAEAILDTPGSFKDVARRMGNWKVSEVNAFYRSCEGNQYQPDAAAVALLGRGYTTPAEFLAAAADPFDGIPELGGERVGAKP